jgi:hypothetical protein
MVMASLTWGAVASAQTASDKATARQMATEGIQSYKQGKHAEALDLLQRAEQLYDAPVHLIYIARVQAALGKLVEASETYRRLARTDLAAGAPQAFKDAVTDAQKELQLLEPKIPSLRIDVGPPNTKGLQLKLDGEILSSVVVGINRPTNPGKHTVEAAAADFDAATATVDLLSGGKQSVTLQLRPRPGAPAPALASSAIGAAAGPISTPAVGQPIPTAGASVPPPAVDKPAKPFDVPPQIVIGARLSLAMPGGKIRLGGADTTSIGINGVDVSGNPNTDASLSNRFSGGIGFEVSAGYRVSLGAKFALMPAVAVESNWFNKGAYYALPITDIIQDYIHGPSDTLSTVLQVIPRETSVLLGGIVEYPRADHSWSPSYYAELFAVVYQQLKATSTVATGSDTPCKISDTYTGSGLKIGAGVFLPATKFLRMAVGLGVTAVEATSRVYWDTCQRRDPTTRQVTTGKPSTNVDISGDKRIHTIAALTLGGDFLIGL